MDNRLDLCGKADIMKETTESKKEVAVAQRVDFDPERWLEEHGNYLFRYALYRLGDASLAEDMVQESLAAGFRGRKGFTGKSSERTWLVGILKHKMIDHLRRVYRERDALGEIDDGSLVDVEFNRLGMWVEGPRTWSVNPATIAERKDFWGVFRRCMDTLTPAMAETFAMRELDGLSVENICKVLEITPNNLWVRLHRARLVLRRCLEEKWFGRGVTRERA